MTAFVYLMRVHELFPTRVEQLLRLPDAEHVHVHKQPDGSYTATPMRKVDPWSDFGEDAVHYFDVVHGSDLPRPSAVYVDEVSS